jgi:hypothetical protein
MWCARAGYEAARVYRLSQGGPLEPVFDAELSVIRDRVTRDAAAVLGLLLHTAERKTLYGANMVFTPTVLAMAKAIGVTREEAIELAQGYGL